MSALEEIAFLQHLTDIDSVEYIVREGFDPDILPSPEAQQVYRYAIDYFFNSGKARAVNTAALSSFEVSVGQSLIDVLTSIEVNIEDDPEISIVDAMEKLRGRYILRHASQFNRDFSIDMADASSADRLEVATKAASALMVMISKLTSHRYQQEVHDGVPVRLDAYEQRLAGQYAEGMGLGVKDINDHTFLVHPGELAIFGAAPKVGKSLWAILVAMQEWESGRSVVLFTLENSVEMTLDRFICVCCCIDSSKFQKGKCSPGEVQTMQAFRERLAKSETKVHIVQPPKGQRTVEFMMRQAQVLDVDSVVIDQITHIEHHKPGNKPRWEVVRDIVQDLKLVASTADPPLPVLAFHQVSRDGKKEADKRGEHHMEDFSESSEIERSADFAVMLYQSQTMRSTNTALLQLVAGRRVDTRKWSVDWFPSTGHVRVRGMV